MSGLFQLGLEEDQKHEDVDLNIGVEDLLDAAETMEIEETSAAIENMQQAVEKGMESAELLEDIIAAEEAGMEADEVSPEFIKAMNLAHEGLAISLGVEADVLLPGCESDDPKEQLSAGLEADKNILQKIWDTIKKVVSKIIQFVKDLITKVSMKIKNLDKLNQGTVDKAKKMVKDGFKKDGDWKDKSLEGVSAKLLGLCEVSGIKKLNDSGFNSAISSVEDLTDAGAKFAGDTDPEAVANLVAEIESADLETIGKKVTAVSKVMVKKTDLPKSGYADKTYEAEVETKTAKEFFGEKVAEKLGLDGDTEVVAKITMTGKTVKDADKAAEKLNIKPLDPKKIASNPLDALVKKFDKNSKANRDATEAMSNANKKLDAAVKNLAKKLSGDEDGFMTKRAVARNIMKIYNTVTSSVSTVVQRTTLDGFKNTLALLSWQEKSLGAFKSE